MTIDGRTDSRGRLFLNHRLAGHEVDIRYTRHRQVDSEGRVNLGREMGEQHVTVEIENVDDLDPEDVEGLLADD